MTQGAQVISCTHQRADYSNISCGNPNNFFTTRNVADYHCSSANYCPVTDRDLWNNFSTNSCKDTVAETDCAAEVGAGREMRMSPHFAIMINCAAGV